MTGPELVQFSFAVSRAFIVNELQLLLLGMNLRFEDYAPALLPYPEQIDQLVARANSQGWIGQFVVVVVRAAPHNEEIQAFLQTHPHLNPSAISPGNHPCDTLFVFGGKCFIGRANLRRFLKAMTLPTGKKVLVVTSERRKVGKSYSRVLVDFLAQHQQPAAVVAIDLDQDDYDPGTLAEAIAGRLGVTTSGPLQDRQQAPRWNQALVEWIAPLTPVPLATQAFWIVLDGFRQKPLSEALQDFIAQLAQRIQGMSHLRLILLNYTYRLPLAVEAFVFKDRVEPIEQGELEVFLSAVYERKHGVPPVASLLSDHVSKVYGRLAEYSRQYPEAVDDLILLNMAVGEEADSIQS